MLVNPNNPNAEENLRLAREAARVIGRQIIIVKAGAASDFDTAFSIAQQRAAALVIAGDSGVKHRICSDTGKQTWRKQ